MSCARARWRLLLGLVSAALVMVAGQGAGEESEPVEGSSQVVYRIQPGETLWRISQRTGVSVEALVRANGIDDVHRIPAGSPLVIPRTESDKPPRAEPTTSPAEPTGELGSGPLDPAAGWDPSAVDGLLARAEDELRGARFEEALATVAEARLALGSAPAVPAAAVRWARVAILDATAEVAFGRYAAALRQLELALEANPDLVLDTATTSPKLVRLAEAARRRAREAAAGGARPTP